MTMKSILLLVSLLATPLAKAEIRGSFSIQSAVNQALDRNPDILTARESLRQSQETFSFAITKLFPTITGTLRGDHEKQSSVNQFTLFGGRPYDQYSASLTLNQPLYDGALFSGYSYSKKDMDIKQYQVDIAERTLTESVVENFYSVLLNERLLQILKDTYEVDKETLAIAQHYYKIGRAQKLDVLQLQTQVALLPPQIAQAEDQMATSAAQLATLLRDLGANTIRIQGKLVSPDPTWVKKMAAEKKIPELPDVLSARVQVDQFHDNRNATLAVYWPTLNLQGDIGRQAYNTNDLTNSRATAWDVALVLSVPIFSGLGSIYQDRALAAQERQFELAETKTTDTVSVNQIQAEKNLDVAQTELASSREAAMYGRESLQEAQRQYRLQTINYLQYQSSQQAYLTAETGYNQAKYNYIVAVAKYFNAIGVPASNLVGELENLTATAKEEE